MPMMHYVRCTMRYATVDRASYNGLSLVPRPRPFPYRLQYKEREGKGKGKGKGKAASDKEVVGPGYEATMA